MTTNTNVAVPDPESARAHLDALALRLGRNAWYARVNTMPDGTLSLHVINPADLADERLILVEDEPQGGWYRFHDGASIAPIADPDRAAHQIVHLMSAPRP